MAYRVIIAKLMHDTDTFSKLPTTLEAYHTRALLGLSSGNAVRRIEERFRCLVLR